MTEPRTWLRTKVRMGGLLLIAGIAVFAASLALQAANPNGSFDFRIVGGLGIGLGGSGVGVLVRYLPATRNDLAARRIVAEERDERSVQIRQRAAARGFWVAMALLFGGLMWTSFASNGKLPAIDGDALWNYLAIASTVPFVIYAVSLIVEERNA